MKPVEIYEYQSRKADKTSDDFIRRHMFISVGEREQQYEQKRSELIEHRRHRTGKLGERDIQKCVLKHRLKEREQRNFQYRAFDRAKIDAA